MSKVSTWWTSWGFGKERHRPETDFADMGTAFGLDASFGREEGADRGSTAARPTAPGQAPDAGGAEGAMPRNGTAHS